MKILGEFSRCKNNRWRIAHQAGRGRTSAKCQEIQHRTFTTTTSRRQRVGRVARRRPVLDPPSFFRDTVASTAWAPPVREWPCCSTTTKTRQAICCVSYRAAVWTPAANPVIPTVSPCALSLLIIESRPRAPRCPYCALSGALAC